LGYLLEAKFNINKALISRRKNLEVLNLAQPPCNWKKKDKSWTNKRKSANYL